MKRNTYSLISQFGPNKYDPSTNPLSYAIGEQNLEQRFLHGSSSYIFNGQGTKNSQAYLSQYCSEKWDDFCELASRDRTTLYPNQIDVCCTGKKYLCGVGENVNGQLLTAGDILIRNTASTKYLKEMYGCVKKFEPFDPTVGNSPLIYTWVPINCNSGCCVPVYSIDPKTIDNDVVMDKLLAKPYIAFDILNNIYNTLKNEGKLKDLKGTKLGNFYSNVKCFKDKGGLI
jgi:hypothetical protein